MTNHLDALKKELAEAKQEAWQSQATLSDLRGSLRGLIEQSRLFDANTGAPSTSTGTLNVVEVSELEKLLIDRADDSLMKSK